VEAFRALLISHRETEKKNLFAPKGCHRDDVVLRINGKAARFYASQGQQRSAVLTMKLAEGEMSRRVTGESPVFLLDDVLSELDASRREFVLSHISSGQVILTSCDTDGFEAVENLHTVRVCEGKYYSL
jgi:DNA replication and repair protein RecF